MKARGRAVVTAAWVIVFGVAGWAGCGGDIVLPAAPDASVPDAGDPRVISPGPVVTGSDAATPDAGCPDGSPLDCYVSGDCTTPTSITGTVYDPAGRNPVYNAIVFIPEAYGALPPLSVGVTACNTCANSVSDYVTATLTDAAGRFTLSGIPSGVALPIVVQTGKWRRTVTLPAVAACSRTAVADGVLRLPRNRSEGDLPQMAVLSGDCDRTACFLQAVGVDPAEFGAPHGGGKVDVYQGLGAGGIVPAAAAGASSDCTTDACPLWSSKSSLEAYDQVFLGCECDANQQTKPPASLQALHDWVGEGGKVFAVHSQATWLARGPSDFQSVATWTTDSTSLDPGPLAVDTSFAKGTVLAEWLAAAGALDFSGLVDVGSTDVSSSVASLTGGTVSDWLDDPAGGDASRGASRLFSFGLQEPAGQPSDAVQTCGKVIFTDVHPGGALLRDPPDAGGPFVPPPPCDLSALTPEEKVLEFMLFDDNVCVGTMPHLPPAPPPPPNF